jgi:uncharacterized protein YbjT (DUF2867 family)
MLLVTTPTGNSGRVVLERARATSQPVRVLVRDAMKLDAATRATCDVVEGDLRNEAVLDRASRGVQAAFFCIPLQTREPQDVAAYHRSFTEPAAKAFAAAGVERVVTISGGRGNPSDAGPNGPLARMEQRFDATVPATRHVRCGYFMENFLHFAPLLKFRRSFSLPIDPAYPLVLESARDIGDAAAQWLLDSTWAGHEGVNVPRGEVLSCQEIATTMSRALGKTIAFEPITGEAYKAMLIKRGGLSEPMAQSLKEMFEHIDHGTLGGKTTTKRPGGLSFEAWGRDHLKPATGLWSVLRRLTS